MFQQIKKLPRTEIDRQPAKAGAGSINFNLRAVPEVAVNSKLGNPLSTLQEFIERFDGRVLFCAESAGRREVLAGFLKKINIVATEAENWQGFINSSGSNNRFSVTTYPIDQGVYSPDQGICLITEGELFGQQVMQRRRRSKASESPDHIFKSLAELQHGAPVVHEQKNIDTVLLLDPKNEEANYMLMEIELKRSNYSKVKELADNFSKICNKLCDKKNSILESLKNLEPKNES